jgi:crotonobetainyl-CoA:carnitine CoA-transferase CaiB-like acyl-CoA transferase
MLSSSAPLPLDGIVVAEFTHTIMGPSCGLILADLGADVIRIEPSPDGDRTRRLPGYAAGFYTFFNRNKQSIALDLKALRGREVAQRLLRSADVLIENFAPETMERLGLGYADASALNPRLIYCSLKGFLSGLYERRPALDEVVQMMGGLAYMTGPPGSPMRSGASIVDILGGTFGAVAILAALHERERTGRGQLVRSALFESVAYLMGQHMASGAILGAPVPPFPVRLGAWGIYDIFHTRDGVAIFVAITSERAWQSFCAAFERADLLADERLQTNNDRVRERGWLQPEVARIVADVDAADLTERCERAGVAYARVGRPEDLFDDPHLVQGGRLLPTRSPAGDLLSLPQLPIEMDGRSFGIRRQPPGIGEGSRALLLRLGYGAAEIAALFADGIAVDGEQHG